MLPAVVRDIDVTRALPDLSDIREDGTRAGQAHLLVRFHAEPLGQLRLDLPAGGLSAAELARRVTSAFGSAIATRIGAPLRLVPVSGVAAPDHEGAARPETPVTAVVCTRGRPQSLARTLDSLLAQSRAGFDILVVESGPTDDATLRVVRGAARRGPVHYLAVTLPGLSRARNAAVAASPGATLAWVDDDEIVDEHWLDEISRALDAHPQADVICGAVVPAELETPAQIWFEEFGGLVKGRGFTPAVFSPATRDTHNPLFPLPPFGAGANMVTRAGVVERAGGFDVALGAGTPAMGGEDTLFFTTVLRSGGMLVYQPSILARHYHRRDLDGLRAQLVGYGTGLTAAYAALLRREPRAATGLLRLAPRAAREVLAGRGARTATIGPEFPRDLLHANRRAMLRGPSAYRRGRAAAAPGPDPVKVVLVNVDAGIPPVLAGRPDGAYYRSARLIALRAGRPVGEVTASLPPSGLSAAEVTDLLSTTGGPVSTAPLTRTPPITIVIPSMFARRPALERCVAALSQVEYPDFDVIIVDNRPSPERGDWLRVSTDPRVRVVEQVRPGTSAARNRGLALARGEIVAFTDDDAVVDPRWLRCIAARFASEPDADCVTGLVLPGELETPAQVLFEESGRTFGARYSAASFAGGPYGVTDRLAADPGARRPIYATGGFGTGSNMAFRTAALRQLGGFDEALGPGTPARAGEDLEVFVALLTAGGRLAYEPGAFVRHWHRPDLAGLQSQLRGYGVGLTAMIAAAVRRDPRHLLGLASVAPRAAGFLFRRGRPKAASIDVQSGLARAQLAGMLVGPAAYLRGRLRMRRWST
jgi:glycosyltransferase involved in cell wall biosynthesis